MDSNYTEMSSANKMPNSMNMIVTQQRSLYRPPSLSESCARTPENIIRAQAFIDEEQGEENTDIIVRSPGLEQIIVEILVKLSFHVALISIFETLFFFFFVSSLEDTGIQTTVHMFISDAVDACSNLTPSEIILVDNVLEPYINVSTIDRQAANEYAMRTAYNAHLFDKAWIYVGSLCGLFCILALYTRLRKLTLSWKKILLENLAMVILLALYEYMFFSSVIVPYKAVSAQEIARNAIQQMQTTCGILK